MSIPIDTTLVRLTKLPVPSIGGEPKTFTFFKVYHMGSVNSVEQYGKKISKFTRINIRSGYFKDPQMFECEYEGHLEFATDEDIMRCFTKHELFSLMVAIKNAGWTIGRKEMAKDFDKLLAEGRDE